MKTIDERVRDVLRVKFLTGLFDHPYVSEADMERADTVVNGPEHNKTALQASLESLILLKNDGLLPLDAASLKRVAVIGPNADEDGYAHVHYGPQATESVTVFAGLKKALEGKAKVFYTKGCEHVDSQWPDSEIYGFTPTKEERQGIRKAVRLARRSDVAVLVLGGNLRTCGENRSRTSLDLPPVQQMLVQEVKKTGKPMILVLINGRPLTINKEERLADAIIEAWYPGAHGGTAVAMALLGEYNPGGRLSVTFPRTVGQVPYNFPYKPGSQVDGYVGVGPKGLKTRASGCLYPFGFGLSYTTFAYSDLSLSADRIMPGDSLKVTFTLTNTGQYAGDEVAQLYLTDRVSSITVYEKLLRGFERVHLEPGESRQVTMTLPPDAFEMLNLKMERVIEPGIFEISIGSSSEDIRLGALMTVQDPKHPDKDFRPAPPAIAGMLPVALKAGDEITFPLQSTIEFEKCELEWSLDARCRYQILINQGGGQFAPLAELTTEGGLQKPRFDRADYKASDLKIQLLEGSGTLIGFDCLAL